MGCINCIFKKHYTYCVRSVKSHEIFIPFSRGLAGRDVVVWMAAAAALLMLISLSPLRLLQLGHMGSVLQQQRQHEAVKCHMYVYPRLVYRAVGSRCGLAKLGHVAKNCLFRSTPCTPSGETNNATRDLCQQLRSGSDFPIWLTLHILLLGTLLIPKCKCRVDGRNSSAPINVISLHSNKSHWNFIYSSRTYVSFKRLSSGEVPVVVNAQGGPNKIHSEAFSQTAKKCTCQITTRVNFDPPCIIHTVPRSITVIISLFAA